METPLGYKVDEMCRMTFFNGDSYLKHSKKNGILLTCMHECPDNWESEVAMYTKYISSLEPTSTQTSYIL